MTLILGMSKADGIYMSTDYRVTTGRTGKVVDDAAPKFLHVHYPPEGGPRALLAYTGLAILPDGTRTGDWMRETLRGDMSEGFDQSMAHLRARLNRDIARLKQLLIINVMVIAGGQRSFGGLSNLKAVNGADLILQDSFGYVMQELKEPFLLQMGRDHQWRCAESISLSSSLS